MAERTLQLGRERSLGAPAGEPRPLALPTHHLVTHGVLVGMTGSGKTGLAMVLIEEALRAQTPVLMVDIKGDLPNLLLAFGGLGADEFAPWVDPDAAAREGKSVAEVADGLARSWREGLAGWGLGPEDVRAFRAQIAPRILTPGATFGEPVHVLSALESASDRWSEDEEGARESLSGAVSLLLRLLGHEGDPTRSREHVALSLLAERRLRQGRGATLEALLEDLARPPIAKVGTMTFDDFLPQKERTALSQGLNTLLASPSFASWRQGAPLDVGRWLARRADGRTPAVIVSVAHLDDDERQLVLGLLFDALLGWVRTLAGTSALRALVVFDEVYGFVPPHPASPPTKKPLLALMKQARAFGVGVVLATQNPMDLDYKALSNAGVWLVGRLQTDADRARVVDGLSGSDGGAGGLGADELASALKSLPRRMFLLRDVHRAPACALIESRWCLSWLRGPMTRQELRRLSSALGAPRGEERQPTESSDSSPPPEPPASSGTDDVRSERGESRAVPPAPEGWTTWHGYADPGPVSRWRYVPYVAVRAAAHLRDAKLGLDVVQTAILAAPLQPDGRADISRALRVDAQMLACTPPEGARYAPLPEALDKAPTRRATERAMRDHAARTFVIERLVHEELGLVQGEGERREGFAQRCREAAMRALEAQRAALDAKVGPKLHRLADKVRAEQSRYAIAQAQVQSAPGGIELLARWAAGGRSALGRAEQQRSRAMEKLDRIRVGVTDAEAALREAQTAREHAMTELRRAAERAPDAIVARQITARKADVEVIEIGVAWARG